MVTLNHPFQGLTRVFSQMEAIRNRYGVRSSATDRAAVIGRAIASNKLHTRVFLEPGCSSVGSSVGEKVDNRVTLTVSEHGAKDLAFAQGNIIDTKHARRWYSGRRSAMSASKQGVSTRRHGTSSTLASSSFTTKCQSQVTERLIQAVGSLSGGGNQLRQALSEGDRRTGRMEAAKAVDVEQEANGQTTHRQITGQARGVAMNTS